MDASVEHAAAELAALLRLEWQRLGLAVGAGLAAALLTPVELRLAIAVGVGALFEALLAAASRVRRQAVIASLAVDPEAYVLPEVRRYGTSLTSLRRRRQLARMIASMLRDAGAGVAGVELVDRVAWQAPALAALAEALGDRRSVVEPAALAACVQLLTDGERSPLLNRSLPRDELERAMRRIHRGISPRTAPRGDTPHGMSRTV